jgi:hypothetical protein
MVTLLDHRLPLIRLKEMRRELVLALSEDRNAIDAAKLHEIASIQQAIAAAEEVIADIDAELERDTTDFRINLRHYA